MKKFIYFSAEWCGPCKVLAPIMQEINSKGMPVEKVDVDFNQEFALKYRIRNIPTVVLVNGDKEIQRFVGSNPASIYENAFKSN
jgi:thioredoxin 1